MIWFATTKITRCRHWKHIFVKKSRLLVMGSKDRAGWAKPFRHYQRLMLLNHSVVFMVSYMSNLSLSVKMLIDRSCAGQERNHAPELEGAIPGVLTGFTNGGLNSMDYPVPQQGHDSYGQYNAESFDFVPTTVPPTPYLAPRCCPRCVS